MLTAILERARITRALRVRSFALLWVGQTVSALGDSIYTIGIAWLVLALTGSATAMGIVVLANAVPILVVPLLGGAIADRMPRLLVLLWSDVLRASIVLILAALSWLHLVQLWHLVILAFVFGVCESLFYPAYQAIRPQLVPDDTLLSANAITGLSRQLSRLVGPLLGAAIVTLLGPPAALACDGVSFVVSACSLLLLLRADSRLTLAKPWSSKAAGRSEMAVDAQAEWDAERRTLRHALATLVVDVRDGFRYIAGSTWLWVSIALASLINVGLFAPLLVTLPKLIRDDYHAGATLFGEMVAASAVGSIAALLVLGHASNLRRRGVVAYCALMGCSIALIVLGLTFPRGLPTALVACSAEVILGGGLGLFGTIWETLLQQHVAVDILGRVSSVDLVVSSCLLPLGYLVAGVVTDRFSPSLVFVAAGVFDLALAGLALTVPAIWRLD